MDVDALREEIEKLVLLEEVAERRQQLIEKQLDDAIQEGLSQETIRKELNLSEESIQKLLDQKTPALAERLGISQQTAADLSQPIG
jgi:orotate phosphoribosyltransferase-like protein